MARSSTVRGSKGSTKAKFSDKDADENDDIDLDADADENDDDDDDDDEDEDEDELKGGGKKALEAERKARRASDREVRQLRRQLAEKSPKKKAKAKDDDDEDDDDKGPSAREVAADNKLKRAGLRSALTDAGVSTRNVRLLVGQVNLDDIDLNDDDDIEDAEDFVRELKDEFPDLFRKAKSDDDEDDEPRRGRITRGGSDTGGRRPARRVKDSTDRLVEQLVGKG